MPGEAREGFGVERCYKSLDMEVHIIMQLNNTYLFRWKKLPVDSSLKVLNLLKKLLNH